MKHIGIVGCSAEGAALCYRTICQEGAKRLGGHDHPEVSIHTHSLGEYVRRLDQNDLKGVGELMLSSADKLASAGADLLICPDNTIHDAWAYIEAKSPLPWLHIADVVTESAAERGFKRVGILGTHWLTGSEVYPSRLVRHNLGFVRPSDPDRLLAGQIIMDEFVHGRFESASIDRLRSIIDRLRQEGADAVVLGCTELPLVLGDHNSSLPTLDSTRLLAQKALECALAT